MSLKGKVLENKITKGNERLMYRLYHSKKDLNSFIKYYTEQLNDNNLNEWIYFQNEIYSSPNYLSKLFSYIHETENHTVHLKFNEYREYLIGTLNFEVQRIFTLDIHDIAAFKKYFKNTIYRYVYETLVLLKKESLIEKKNSSFMDVKDLFPFLRNARSGSNTVPPIRKRAALKVKGPT